MTAASIFAAEGSIGGERKGVGENGTHILHLAAYAQYGIEAAALGGVVFVECVLCAEVWSLITRVLKLWVSAFATASDGRDR
eukprot:CAMPEP_0119534304 /NCGR_PEP_ID=MMETSP1344-20130328/47570_1 /TAXON_ID=236787 /ORGANISM="Florenciella parvula, Strain CCMP2471" /LENGTH=81 /DNA_ID=CAMNT_0007575525 /DNA_START=39 /DNA_END=281 /DNA_ORIENTATION=-